MRKDRDGNALPSYRNFHSGKEGRLFHKKLTDREEQREDLSCKQKKGKLDVGEVLRHLLAKRSPHISSERSDPGGEGLKKRGSDGFEKRKALRPLTPIRLN